MIFSSRFDNLKKISALFLILITLIFIDQLSKYFIRLKGGFYICNPNISWGINLPEFVFWIFWLLAISVIIFLLAKKIDFFLESSMLAFILAGAISNIIDRIKFNCVVDFIDLKFWPVFNLADTFIVTGVILLLVRWKKI